MMKIGGMYCTNLGIILPLAEVPTDDIRKTQRGLKKEHLKSEEEIELEGEYQTNLHGHRYPLRHKESWHDVEIKEIIREPDTIESRLTNAVIFDRTPDAIEFIQAFAKRDPSSKVITNWMAIHHHTFLQVKRCQLELGRITEEEHKRCLLLST